MVPVRLRRGVNEVEEVRGSKMGPGGVRWGGGDDVGGEMGWECRGREGYAGCRGDESCRLPGGRHASYARGHLVD